MSYQVPPNYASISFVADVCEPWIDLYGGDEWGESMEALHRACHTSYGFSDDDCALFASKLLENLVHQHQWMEEEGYQYGLVEPEDQQRTEERCRGIRAHWLDGGNFSGDAVTMHLAEEVNKNLPSWLFGIKEDT